MKRRGEANSLKVILIRVHFISEFSFHLLTWYIGREFEHMHAFTLSVEEQGQKIAYGERHLLGLHATYVKLYVMSLCSRSWEQKVGTVIIQLRYEVTKWVVFS